MKMADPEKTNMLNTLTKDVKKRRWTSEPEKSFMLRTLSLEDDGLKGFHIDQISLQPQPWAKSTPRLYLETGGEHRMTFIRTKDVD